MASAQHAFVSDLFVSYAHRDDQDGWVARFVDAIREEHARFTPIPLRSSSTAPTSRRCTTGSTASSAGSGTPR